MDKGKSLIIPHLFDGTNYAYWKVRIRAFLQSLDERVWQVVEIGQTKPTEAPANQDDAKIKVANFNSKALNSLFSVVTNEEFKKISSTETAKKAWTILKTTCEGTKAIKDSKFQRLTTSFEEIKMEKDESFDDYGIPTYISWCNRLKKLNIKFFPYQFLKDSSSCQLQKCA